MTNLNTKSPPSAPPAAATEAPQIVSRLKGETSRAYAYAWKYITMGRGRSIEKVSAEVNITARQLERCSTKWRWVERAAAYDTWLEDKNREAMDLFATQDAAKSAQRERDRREKDWDQAQMARRGADLMFAYPLTETKRVLAKDADGRETQIQIIKPARWSKRDAVTYMFAASELSGRAIRNEGAVATKVDEVDVYHHVPYVSTTKAPGGRKGKK